MLEVSSLSAGYGSFQALFGVSLKVEAGEAVAVIGPNGAGKTTLLRAISRLLEPTSGTLTMQGRDYTTTARTRGDRPGHRAGARRPAAVPAPVGRGQPEDRRLHAQRACPPCRAAGVRVLAVPAR